MIESDIVDCVSYSPLGTGHLISTKGEARSDLAWAMKFMSGMKMGCQIFL